MKNLRANALGNYVETTMSRIGNKRSSRKLGRGHFESRSYGKVKIEPDASITSQGRKFLFS